jgi:hypothetical protein
VRSEATGGEYHQPMRSVPTRPIALTLAALGVSLAGCGSSTKTVSVNGAPTSQTQPAHTASTPAHSSASTPVTGAGATPSPTGTRSAPEPAFTGQEHSGPALSAATAVLRSRGYTPTNASDYHPGQALEVLVGMHIGSGDGYGQQAFFFVNGRYIGTDASRPSATLRVVNQSDTEVTLAYPLYHSGDPLCCPGGGQTHVRFQLNNGKLTALDPIPPLSSKSGLNRY